ncbi:MAG TPA: nickel-type superoxide dismutase maturation protease [Dehalococcoidia bacterium]|nr:nickel-type superoxide dismutase maturation protease [Dehalococcoidia bacterium]
MSAVVAAAERVSPFVRVRVEGDSMAPAYSPGDRLLVNRLAYLFRRPRPGDVVVLRDPEVPGRLLLKRVAAVEEGRYVVLGDNTAESRDSRRFGPVRRRDIVGKAVLRY